VGLHRAHADALGGKAEPQVKRARPIVMRPYIRRFSVAVAAMVTAALIALTGCGSATAPGGGSSTSSSPAEAKVSLTLTLTNNPGHSPQHWTLRCDPAAGSRPDATAACSALLRMKQPFALRSKREVCPMIMVSARQYVVIGTWFGVKVHRVVVDGGCDLGLFNTLAKVMH